jgi:hypothetical protein
MYIGLHVKYPLFKKLEFCRQIFVKSSNIKFHENPSSGSRDVPRGRTDMTKLIVTFRNFANASKNRKLKSRAHVSTLVRATNVAMQQCSNAAM